MNNEDVIPFQFHEGDILKYFKYNQKVDKHKYLYKFICEAINAETKEEFIVYQAVYWGNEEYYIKPKKMFYSKVDKEKYPGVKQQYKFELLDICVDCGKFKDNNNLVICDSCFSKVLDEFLLNDKKKGKDNNENK